MRLDGRRESSNVEDRRGLSGKAVAGGGIGAVIIAALFAWMSGGDPLSAGLQAAQEQMAARTETVDEATFTEEEQELASDCKKILASTVPGDGRNLYTANACVVLESGELCLWRCNSSRRSFLLFWRPEVIYRPVVLHSDEAPVGCRG